MHNYNTNKIKAQKLNEQDFKECEIALRLIYAAGGNFIVLNKNGNPSEKYKKLDRKPLDIILNS